MLKCPKNVKHRLSLSLKFCIWFNPIQILQNTNRNDSCFS